MKKIILFFSILFLWTCGGGGGDKATGPEEPPIVINLTSLGGQAQKGPFNNGTSINVAELSSTLSPTGRNFSSAITDNSGSFAVANVQLESPYVELRALGFYFNEVANEISDAQLTLYALSNLTGKTSLNVNIITHLEKNRMTTLMSGETPKTFAQAKLQAQEEVFAVFDYSRANVPESELLDISQGGAANGKLLAMSAIIQGDLTVGQMSQLLANISTDIASDGTLDDASLRATLINNSKNLDMAEVRANLVAHYSSLGVTATIPDFETEVNQFLKPPVAQDMSASTAEDTAINITLAGSDPEGESLTYTILEVNNATVTLNGNVANYDPDANFNGTDTFTYKVNDGTVDSNIATVTMTVSAEDDEPNTNNVSTTTDEDVAVAINLTADEYDGQNYSFNIVSDPSNGTVSLSGTTATYTPNQDFNGTDTFTFEATDDRIMFGKQNVATATITVNAINDAPTSSEVSGSSNEDTAIDIALSATDVDQDNLTYSIVSDVSNGTTSISGSTLTYTPNQDWNGTDTFTYKVNDGTVDSNTSNGTITIAAVNDAPTTSDISTTIDENRTARMVGITLQGNDVDGDALTYSVVTDASNGTTSLSGSTLTYTANQDWNGSETITYKANDGTVDSNTATVTITVNAVNDAPVLVDRTETTDEDNAKTFSVLSDVTDVDSDGVSYNIVSQPSNGAVTIATDLFTYTPNDNWNGTDTFTWKVNDGSLDSNTATVTITVNPVNDAPTTADIAITMDENRSARMIGIELQGSDVEGDDLTYSVVSDASNGSTNPISSGYLHYFPNDDWNGTETITYKANDGSLDSNTSTITVTVTAVNDAPVTTDASASTNEDTNVLTDLTSNITDIDNSVSGGLVNSIIVSLPSNGSLYQWTDGSNTPGSTALEANQAFNNSAGVSKIWYTPNANWNGTDTFTWKANDGTADSNTSTVTITVNAVNDAPVSSAVSASTSEDIAKTVTLDATDVEGDALTYSIVSNPSKGSLGSVSGTDVVYTPNANWNGIDTFTYKANDGALDGNTSTVTIDIANVGGEISFLNETNDDVGHNNTHRTEDAYTLKWNYTGGGTSETYNIYLNHYEGQSQWGVGTFSRLIATVDPQVSRYDGTFDSDLYYHGSYYFKIVDADESIRNPDESTLSTFNILPKDAYATMVDPNGGEDLVIGSTYTIKYDVSDDVNTGYNPGVELHLYKNDIFGHLGEIDGVSNYINSNGEYEWNITNVYDPGTYLIELRAMSHIYDLTDNTFTIRNEIVGTLKLYPDLTSDYNEWFSDIVYDETTGGFIVAGMSIDKNDNGSGGTKEMFHLRTDSSLDVSSYETISTTLNSWGNPSNNINNSAHQFGVSERSLSSNYLLSTRSDYLWLVDSSGGVTYKQLSGQLDSTYSWIDYIKQSYPTSDGGFLIFGTTGKNGSTQDRYPVIVKLDASLNVDYFKVLNNHVANTSWVYYAQAQGMVQAADGVYYLVAGTNRTGISNSHAIQFYKVEDSGSALSITQHVDLSSSIANSPTSFTSSDDFDTMGYLPGTSSSDAEFVIVTDNNELTRYNIDSSGNAQVKGTFDLNSVRTDYTTHQTYMEIASGNNYLYVVAQSTVGSSSDITVAKLSESLSVLWEKTLDITGRNQEDKLGGVTSIQFGSNSTGIAITGSTQSSSGDWDGFILLLDSDGNRIF